MCFLTILLTVRICSAVWVCTGRHRMHWACISLPIPLPLLLFLFSGKWISAPLLCPGVIVPNLVGFPPCFVSPYPCLASVVHSKCKCACFARSQDDFAHRAEAKYRVSGGKEALNRCIITSSVNCSNVVISQTW